MSSFQKITPTRTNYFKLRNRLQFTSKGKKLLEIKREQFYNEIQRLKKRVIGEKEDLRQLLEMGYYNLNNAYAFSGKTSVKFLSEFLKKHVKVRFKVAWAHKFGIEVPKFRDLSISQEELTPYGFGEETSIYLDVAIKLFRQALATILNIAEIEGELFKLAFEFHKLKRRISALEDLIIPRLTNDMKAIEAVLEDLEQEESIRLKKIKRRLELKALAARGKN